MKYTSLFFALATLSSAAFSADEINNSQTTVPIEYVNSCKGLSEKDSCQVHGKTNNLVTGFCKTKAITPDNFNLVCVPEQANKIATQDADSNSDPDSHQHKYKRH